MADCAFNWCEMENDLCNPEYSKNYFRTNKLNWDDIKERHPENIWLIRKKDHKFWLLGRLAVDVDKKISPPRKSEKFWITFDPSKSTFYSDPLIISNELAETLGSVCGRIFRKGNGIGVNAATMLDPGEESVMKKADARNNKISLHDFAAKIKAGIISGTPYQKSVTATKPRTGKASENPNPPENESTSSSIETSVEMETRKNAQESELKEAIKNALSDIDSRMQGEDIDAIVKRRIGQTLFRELLEVHHGPLCHVTMVSNRRLLIASHIVPWSQSNGDEKVDRNNGLLLAVNWDTVFDKGFVTFDDQGNAVFSDDLDEETIKNLGLNNAACLREGVLTAERKAYLKRHNDVIFEKWKKVQ